MVKTCQICGQQFKCIAQELAFYEKMGLPTPDNCPPCRHKRRMALRNDQKFHKYPCAKCEKEMVTTVDPEKGLTVYCLDCYADFRATVDLTQI